MQSGKNKLADPVGSANSFLSVDPRDEAAKWRDCGAVQRPPLGLFLEPE